MPLYDDVTYSDKAGIKKSDLWSQNSGIKLLQDHLQAKKRISQHQSDGSPSSGSSKNSGTISNKSLSTVITAASLHNQNFAGVGSMLGGDWDPNDEYDPIWPNEYEILQRQFLEEEEKRRAEEYEIRQQQNKQQQSVSPKSHGLTMMTALRGMQDYDEDDDDDENIGHKSSTIPQPNRGIAIAPPPSLTSNSTSTTSNLHHSAGSSLSGESSSTAVTSTGFSVNSVAAKIMSRMGYKDGQGLGKDEQGISRALEVEKTSATSGKIIAVSKANISSFLAPHSITENSKSLMGAKTSNNQQQQQQKQLHQQQPQQQQQKQEQQQQQELSFDSKKEPQITELLKDPTRVILLRNMVGPGEVDDDLDGETKEECSKYGEVIKCLIFEIPNKKVPDDEAVRIFLEFRRVESAIKAVVDLNGRYFGGRVVKASFYNVEKFNRFELAPTQLIKR